MREIECVAAGYLFTSHCMHGGSEVASRLMLTTKEYPVVPFQQNLKRVSSSWTLAMLRIERMTQATQVQKHLIFRHQRR